MASRTKSNRQYLLRWRGRIEGPYTLDAIKCKLDDNEVGLLHDIQINEDEWVTLREFLDGNDEPEDPPPGPPPSLVTGGYSLAVESVSVQVNAGFSTAPLWLLQDVTFPILPNEFVAVLGPSGSGKSTLMDVMTRRRGNYSGRIRINGYDTLSAFDSVRRSIGHVPQKDIVHGALTVEQELTYAAELRNESLDGTAEVATVARVLQSIELQNRRNNRIASLSGGQIKRVSLGVELTADPKVLFLDEATSGLDAGTEARMMELFCSLANGGRTVVCITHNLDHVHLCDRVVVLTRGRLAYFGPPSELTDYFRVGDISAIYDLLESKPAEEWASAYLQSAQYQENVEGRMGQSLQTQTSPAPHALGPSRLMLFARQLGILARRYTAVTYQDRKNALILLVQAPIIAVLLGIVFRNDAQSNHLVLFLLCIAGVWCGCSNSAKEVVKELPIYLRERAINLNLFAYLFSKIAILSLLCAIQSLTLMAIVYGMTSLSGNWAHQLAMVFLNAINGMLLGLAISSSVGNVDKAMALVPIMLIPQVIFASALKPLSGFSKEVGYWLITTYWAFDGMLNSLNQQPAAPFLAKYTSQQNTTALLLFMLALFGLASVALKMKDRHP